MHLTRLQAEGLIAVEKSYARSTVTLTAHGREFELPEQPEQSRKRGPYKKDEWVNPLRGLSLDARIEAIGQMEDRRRMEAARG